MPDPSMFQIRQRDGRVYNAARDIVQLFPAVIGQHATIKISANAWPEAIKKYVEFTNTPNEELVKAAVALANFVSLPGSRRVHNCQAAFAQSGLATLSPAALLTLMAAIGLVTCEVYFQTARASSRLGQTAYKGDSLAETIDRAVHALKAESPRVRQERAVGVGELAVDTIAENDPTVS